ncbi:telomerase-binding protein EST1A isoform X2 [Macrosteles quadrilineatus]|uniref:telomerase-binding protein EST1A isoform X2 n=1 Tax=Macrosteles quadrilineatus TaxID=74068 RepID=UPI0023E1F1E6|nr:telomerase-binding protein EST1A isoform X2 [Macrosteles quadrilineatus]
MTDFREGKLSRNYLKDEMSTVGRKGGKPQVEIYRPGSGPLRKSAYGEEEFYGEGFCESNPSREREERYPRKNHSKKLVDDFDRLSICSGNSLKDRRSTSLCGSTGNLSDPKRRTKKPEVPIYVPPKPTPALPNNQENKLFKTRNYNSTKRSDSFRRDEAHKRDVETPVRKNEDKESQWSDNRTLRGGSEPPKPRQEPRKPNERDKTRRPRKNKKRNSRRDIRDENINQTNGIQEKITPLLDIKFDYNPMIKAGSSFDITGYETNGHTTTDNESERDPLCSRKNNSLQHRNMRQASEPRSLPLSSLHIDKQGRDTRSVEPTDEHQWQQERSTQKPPSGQYGRRGNKQSYSKHKQYHLSFESLPPRLQKKYMEENGLQEPPVHPTYSGNINDKPYMGSNPDLTYNGTGSEPFYSSQSSSFNPAAKSSYVGMNTTYIGTNSEDAWDGGSLTFQGNNQTFYSTVPPPTMFHHPPPPLITTQAPPHFWSQTLPHVRGRGRGRVPHHELERERIAFEEARMARSLTPDALGELERFEEKDSLSPKESLKLEKEKEPSQSNDASNTPRSNEKEEKSLGETKTSGLDASENESATSNKSPTQSTSPQDFIFKKPITTSMNWADEVELSEQMQEALDEKDSGDNTWSLASSHFSPPTLTATDKTVASSPPKDRRKRRKRSNSRERFDKSNANNGRRGSVDDVVLRESRNRKNSGSDKNSVSRSRKNSGDDRHWPRSRKNSGDDRHWPRSRKNSGDDRHWPRSRKNSGDDRHWPRSRKNSGDDRHWPRSRKNSSDDRNWRVETRDPYDNFRISRSDNKFSSRTSSRNNSRHNSRSNSRNNSVERWTHDEYLNFNGSERKLRGGSNERFRRNSVKSHSSSGRRRGSRDISPERMKEPKQEENWREEARRLNGPGPFGETKKQEQRKQGGGILVLPPAKETDSRLNSQVIHTQKQLFDPSNPDKPLIVNTPVDSARNSYQYGAHPEQSYNPPSQMITAEGHFVMPMAHSMPVVLNPNLLKEADIIEYELNQLMQSNSWYEYHDEIIKRRMRLQEILWILLTSDIKFCKQENVEQHFWKILYYGLLEWFRKQMSSAPHMKEAFMTPMLNIIDEGMKYFEDTLRVLEDCYQFKLDDHLVTGSSQAKGKPVSLALVSAQKILLFLGDLARYREQVQDTANYGLARQWYMKAQQLNPKNGRPYYQLAILAMCVTRKFDAIYYYMRSLIAATPVVSAKESLLTLFDENRKKFEQSERMRHEERELREREKMKEKEGDRNNRSHQLRREIWIHPEGGRRVHRTTSTSAHTDSDSETELGALPHLELSKRFYMSFIHVHGKLFMKVGMESFPSAALQMLRQLRALLQHSPLPLTNTRLLQLLALNMFSIENTQLKNSELGPGYRSAMQESALIVSLQMFNILLERTNQLLIDQQNNTYKHIVSDDVQTLLPAIKVWCDWLLCHSSVWNPPPSCHDYRVGPAGDVWARLATLVNLLEKVDCQLLSEHPKEDHVQVRLPEDASLAGFFPLMCNCSDPVYVNKECNMDVAQVSLRVNRILFCGTVFLCGVDPPVLKLHKNDTGNSEYISVVETPSPPTQSDGELCVESVSGGDSQDSGQASDDDNQDSPSHMSNAPGEIQSLLKRKHELERSHRQQERRRQKVQSILQSSLVSVEIEVRPHYLVADTNCFIDYLPQLQTIAKASSSSQPHMYTLMVPLVVLNELDGLAHGRRDPSARPQHRAMVTESAALALEFLRSKTGPGVRCVTTRGTVLNSAAFTSEEDCQDMTNDDKILTTCLKLCHSSNKEEQVEGCPRKLWRDVVLLTEDRNLRVKALARDVPVREVADFLQWAGLELG